MLYRARYPQRAFYGCSCCGGDSRTLQPEVLEHQVCMGKGKRKKPRPKKEKCITGHAHRWLYDTTVTVETARRLVSGFCAECDREEKEQDKIERWLVSLGAEPRKRYRRPYWCMRHGEVYEYTVTKRERICDDCNRVETVWLSKNKPEEEWEEARRKRRMPPKRTVQF